MTEQVTKFARRAAISTEQKLRAQQAVFKAVENLPAFERDFGRYEICH
ncbi:hypothetical protein PPMP20_17910 [Paraburkholderia phymatum]|nr:hypothetical protein [Paraburkholderia phymatum]